MDKERLEEWNEVREIILKRDSYTCQNDGCGYSESEGETDSILQIHHICHREDGGTDDHVNLVTLCDTCHRKYHRRLDLIKLGDEVYQLPPRDPKVFEMVRAEAKKRKEIRRQALAELGEKAYLDKDDKYYLARMFIMFLWLNEGYESIDFDELQKQVKELFDL